MKRNKGFTLIELMVVIAIIAIIAAIAIPNLIQSRIRANEAIAVTVIKAYCTAQVQFEVGKQGQVRNAGGDLINIAAPAAGAAASIYADNYRNLFYGYLAGSQGNNPATALQLISQAHADAFANAGNDGGLATVSNATAFAGGAALVAPAASTPYQGYLFMSPLEANNGRAANFFAGDFAQLALPVNSTSTGTTAYWVGQQGAVLVVRLMGGKTTATLVTDYGSKSPSAAAPAAAWEAL